MKSALNPPGTASLGERLMVLTDLDEARGLRAGWNDAVAAHAGEVGGPDVTSSFEWTTTLWEQRVAPGKARVARSLRRASVPIAERAPERRRFAPGAGTVTRPVTS